jgi:hypothetical protein
MELDIKAVVGQRPNLLAAAIIAHTNNWYFAVFDHLNYRGYSSSVSGTHAVYFIHDYQRFLQIFTSIDVV